LVQAQLDDYMTLIPCLTLGNEISEEKCEKKCSVTRFGLWSANQLAKVHEHFNNLQTNKSLGRCESNCKVEPVMQSLVFWELQCKLILRWQGIP